MMVLTEMPVFSLMPEIPGFITKIQVMKLFSEMPILLLKALTARLNFPGGQVLLQWAEMPLWILAISAAL